MTYRFYIYDLIDPRDGSVFYVGKGQRKRHLDHEKEADAGKRSRKCAKIREIVAAGFKVEHRIVERYELESDAYAAEIVQIKDIGLGNLTNVMPGGPALTPDGQPIYGRTWTKTKVMNSVPTLQRALSLIMKTGGVILRYCGEERDITEDMLKIVAQMMKDIGRKEFYELVGARYGGPQA